MLKRVDKKLHLNTLGLQIFLDDLFFKCKTQEEVEWLSGQLIDYVSAAEEDAMERVVKDDRTI